MIKSYKDLNIWNKGIEIISHIYKATAIFPKEETYGLVAQMKRSAVSIPSNIAEGFARQHNNEYKQFLYIAVGSCAELETQMVVSLEQEYMNKDVYGELSKIVDHEARMIMSMINSVKLNQRLSTKS